MNYFETLEYIWSVKRFGKKSSLLAIKELLLALGNPQKYLKIIHIGGTNGKGSVSSYLSKTLEECGYKTGLYISPYIERFNERIKINSIDISDEDLIKLTQIVKEKVQELNNKNIYPNQFDIITAIAFLYYKQNHCDYVVLEMGIGHPLDATNVIENPVASVLATISYDHQNVLGNTLEEIAKNKCSIIKNGAPIFYYPVSENIENIIINNAKQKNSYYESFSFSQIEISSMDFSGTDFNFKDEEYHINMLGEHQVYNAVLAVITLKSLGISYKNIYEGLKKMTFTGRMEVISKNPLMILDGAHNINGADALSNAILKYNLSDITFVMAFSADKDYKNCVKTLLPHAKEIIFTKTNNERLLDPEFLYNECACEFGKNSFKYFNSTSLTVEEIAGRKLQPVIVCGSLYLLFEMKDKLLSKLNK